MESLGSKDERKTITRRAIDKLLPPMAAASSWASFRFFLANSRSRLSSIYFFSRSANLVPSSQDFYNQQQDTSIDRNKDQSLPSDKVQSQIIVTERVLRLQPNQTFNSSLGDYTQWVHLACPHWFDFPLDTVCPVGIKTMATLILRPPPTARSRPRSRGLHPVGALSVPPLDST